MSVRRRRFWISRLQSATSILCNPVSFSRRRISMRDSPIQSSKSSVCCNSSPANLAKKSSVAKPYLSSYQRRRLSTATDRNFKQMDSFSQRRFYRGVRRAFDLLLNVLGQRHCQAIRWFPTTPHLASRIARNKLIRTELVLFLQGTELGSCLVEGIGQLLQSFRMAVSSSSGCLSQRLCGAIPIRHATILPTNRGESASRPAHRVPPPMARRRVSHHLASVREPAFERWPQRTLVFCRSSF